MCHCYVCHQNLRGLSSNLQARCGLIVIADSVASTYLDARLAMHDARCTLFYVCPLSVLAGRGSFQLSSQGVRPPQRHCVHTRQCHTTSRTIRCTESVDRGAQQTFHHNRKIRGLATTCSTTVMVLGGIQRSMLKSRVDHRRRPPPPQDWNACFWCAQSLCIYREFTEDDKSGCGTISDIAFIRVAIGRGSRAVSRRTHFRAGSGLDLPGWWKHRRLW
ncbi:hypothetical protein BD413DRAFT_518735 [Trametes elegans]|nr:hypothetical protein BD413DRAFT_518735 [Trametes elegans]